MLLTEGPRYWLLTTDWELGSGVWTSWLGMRYLEHAGEQGLSTIRRYILSANHRANGAVTNIGLSS